MKKNTQPFIRNILILYQDFNGIDYFKWFRTYNEAVEFYEAEKTFRPWIACYDRIQLTGAMKMLFEKGQRKSNGKG